MTGRVIFALAIVTAIGYTAHRIRGWFLAQKFLIAAWRFLTGHPLNGHHVTDAGWLRPGQKALTKTGHATRWQHLPRWKRTAHRTGGTLMFLAVVTAFLVNPPVTSVFVLAAVVAVLGLGSWAAWRRARMREARRSFLFPLHLAAHQVAGIPRATRADSWIKPELDGGGSIQSVTLELPAGWPSDAKDEARLAAIVGAKAAIESPKVTWRRDGPVPLLVLRHSPPPPGRFWMGDLLPELPKLREDELLLGIGRDEELVIASLDTDSPHVAISAGTGGTKSNLAGWLLLQVLLRGGLVLDAKRRLSYPWILKDMNRNLSQLPNIAYAWTTAQLHEGMVWLSDELDRRGDVAFAGMDTEGDVHASVGPRQLTVAEELNLAVPRLKMHWAQSKNPGDPPKSPALTGLGEDAFAGREVRKHLVLVGQALTAEVTGSKDSSVRSQCGIKLLARYELPTWRMMCGDVPMPSSPTEKGRYQAVTASGVREVQTPRLERVRARQMVLDGELGQLPSTVPLSLVTGIPRVAERMASPALVTGSAIPVAGPVTGAPRVMVTLKQAVERGHVGPQTTRNSLKMAIWRDHQRPEGEQMAPWPVARDGKEDLYLADEIAAFDASRR
jgi:hypothetical protein